MIDFDIGRMRKRCLAPIKSFESEGECLAETPYLIFKDNRAKILGVAHLDSVQDTTHFQPVTIRKGRQVRERLIFNGQLDDRLGAYLLLDYLPQLGLKFDVLLTDDEECCASTAMLFNPDREYHWMFSFDREGSDVVMYQYRQDKLLVEALKSAGFWTSQGSYSDICDLEHLGCSGFNVGTGLIQGHSDLAHTDLLVLRRQVARFQRFYRQHKDTKFDAPPASRYYRRVWDKGGYWNKDDYWESYGKGANWVNGKAWEQCEWCMDWQPVRDLAYEPETSSWLCKDCRGQVDKMLEEEGKILQLAAPVYCWGCDELLETGDEVHYLENEVYCPTCYGAITATE